VVRVQQIIDTLAREVPENRARDRTALKLALRKRQDRAREYFDELAGKFGRSYVPGTFPGRALSHALISLVPRLTIVDLGAGEGTLSPIAGQERAQSDRDR